MIAVISPLGGYPESPNLGFHEYASQLADAGQRVLRIDCNRMLFKRELRSFSLSQRERAGVRGRLTRDPPPHANALPLGEGTFAWLTYDSHFSESLLGQGFLAHLGGRLTPHFAVSPHLLLDSATPIANPDQALALLTASTRPPALLDLENALATLPALRAASEVHLSVSLPSQVFWALDLAVRLRTLLPHATLKVGGSSWEFFLHHPEARRLLERVRVELGVDLRPPAPSPHPPPSMPTRRVPRYAGARRHTSLSFQTQTGCLYGRCTFCYFPMVTGQAQTSSARKSRQLRFTLRKYRPERLFISDAYVPAQRLPGMLSEIPSGSVRSGISCFVRFEPRFNDPSITRALRDAGLRKVFIGLESGSPRVLRKMDKGITLETASANLTSFAAAGIEVELSIIVGFPTETRAEAEETLAFLERHRAVLPCRPQVFRFTLDPMTPMHALPKAYGITSVTPPASLFYPVFGVETAAGMTRPEANAMADRFEQVLDGLYGARQVDRTNTLGGQTIVVEGKLE